MTPRTFATTRCKNASSSNGAEEGGLLDLLGLEVLDSFFAFLTFLSSPGMNFPEESLNGRVLGEEEEGATEEEVEEEAEDLGLETESCSILTPSLSTTKMAINGKIFFFLFFQTITKVCLKKLGF